MSGDRRRLIDQLFDQVLDSTPAAQEEILARAEREDPDLRRELESLLAAHEHPAGILDSPGPLDALGLPPSLEDASIASAPLRIGIYRVVRELGRGGMGVVFLAERDDGHFFRQVAIKVIGGGLSADLRARFEAERQILASLDHPNIARLYDGGVTPDGHPYLVMEYVPGLPIDEYCRVHRLDVSERVRLFCTAARAVHEAHRSLVVHRDLKPSNILVTRDGEVKLLDFGIAKILDPSVVGGEAPKTRTGLHLMTPEYAAPEQVLGGHITTATDVYGLGVVLFELLTGRRPLQIAGRSPAEWARVILQAAPPTPSSVAELLSPLIPPDGPADPAGTAHDGDTASTPAGEAGLYLALEIDAQSIASREERQRLRRRLRGDLDRILLTALRKEPERRYGSPARLVEDLERHLEGRPVEARADSAGYRMRKYVSRNRVWVGAAVVVFVSLIGGSVAAVTQAHRATRQAELAAGQRDLMFELFRLSDPTETLGDTVTAREILDRGTERIEGEFGDQPEMQAAMLSDVAGVYANIGLLARAEELARRALELRLEHLDSESLEVSESYGQVGRLLAEQGEREEAIEYLEHALDVRRGAVSGPDSLLARTESDLAWQLRAVGRHQEAAALFEEALGIQRELLGDDHPDAASTLFGLATSHHDMGEFDEAEAVFGRALARFDTTRARPHPLAAEALVNIAMIRRLRGRVYEAERLAGSAVAMRAALYDRTHPDVIEAMSEWGVALRETGRYREAQAVLADALQRANEALGPDHSTTLTVRERLGTVLFHQGRYAEAAAAADSSVTVKRMRLGPENPNFIMALMRAADPRWLAGRLEEAEALYEEALRGAGRTSVYAIMALDGLANVAVARGDDEEADHLFEEALGLAEGILRPGHRYMQAVRVDRAQLLLRQGRSSEAVADLEAVLSARRELFEEPHPAVGRALHPLGEALLASDDAAGAERELRQALESYAELAEPHWRVGDASSLLGAAIMAQGRRGEGMRLLRDGHDEVVAHLGADSPQASRTAARLADAGG